MLRSVGDHCWWRFISRWMMILPPGEIPTKSLPTVACLQLCEQGSAGLEKSSDFNFFSIFSTDPDLMNSIYICKLIINYPRKFRILSSVQSSPKLFFYHMTLFNICHSFDLSPTCYINQSIILLIVIIHLFCFVLCAVFICSFLFVCSIL